jgi:hypothetical protein
MIVTTPLLHKLMCRKVNGSSSQVGNNGRSVCLAGAVPLDIRMIPYPYRPSLDGIDTV